MTREVREWWETTSQWFQNDLQHPVELRWGRTNPDESLIESVEGLDVLELGCGGGQCSIALAERGATVTGIDLSRAQLDYAASLLTDRDPDGIVSLVEGDVTTLPFTANAFDLVFNASVFQWVGDIEAAFRHVARVLRPDGRFVFSTPHPYFDIVDPDSHRVEDSYYDTGRQVETDTDLDLDMVTFRHAVGDIHAALTTAGFRVDRVIEPGTSDSDDYEPGPWGETPVDLQAKLPTDVIFDATLSEDSR